MIQAEWKKVMGNNLSHFKGDTLPVERVSWVDCQEFCKKSGLSLPTEAQWEYACRAGKAGPFAGTGELDDMGWYYKSSGRRTHPVGEKLPNDFGLHDMHGNVWEWCEDVYERGFYSKREATKKNPCKSSSGSRVVRGGSSIDYARYCRSAFRHSFPPPDRYFALGFRPAWSSP